MQQSLTSIKLSFSTTKQDTGPDGTIRFPESLNFEMWFSVKPPPPTEISLENPALVFVGTFEGDNAFWRPALVLLKMISQI